MAQAVWSLKTGPIGSPETSVLSYQETEAYDHVERSN